ncbi:MAG TPA: hypothetical protein VHE77_11495 [Dongiaceae bacterium]|jgi:hypothetical protein|nr:hypothetical protein [Dongiaceae bacterium]
MTTISLRKAALVSVFGMAATFAAGYAIAAQPHMQNALRALNRASTELNAAIPDKAGHRVKAINLVNDAIAETQAGIAAGM